MDFQIELESGKILRVDEAIGVVLSESGTFQPKIVERCKSFPLGSFARFEMYELAEICNFMLNSIGTVTASAIDYAKNLGIELVEQPQDTPKLTKPDTRV